jgi:hypothetical protein
LSRGFQRLDVKMRVCLRVAISEFGVATTSVRLGHQLPCPIDPCNRSPTDQRSGAPDRAGPCSIFPLTLTHTHTHTLPQIPTLATTPTLTTPPTPNSKKIGFMCSLVHSTNPTSPASFPLRHFPCIVSPASFPIHRFPCVISPASFPLRRFPYIFPCVNLPCVGFPCVVSPASFPLHRFPCFVSHTTFPLRYFPCVVSPASFPIHRFPCVNLPCVGFPCVGFPWSFPLRHFPCVVSPASFPLRHFPCVISPASFHLRQFPLRWCHRDLTPAPCEAVGLSHSSHEEVLPLLLQKWREGADWPHGPIAAIET